MTTSGVKNDDDSDSGETSKRSRRGSTLPRVRGNATAKQGVAALQNGTCTSACSAARVSCSSVCMRRGTVAASRYSWRRRSEGEL